jgi:hypothetical protein
MGLPRPQYGIGQHGGSTRERHCRNTKTEDINQRRNLNTGERSHSYRSSNIQAGVQTFKQELKADMQTMREGILAKSHTYIDIMTQDLRSKIEGQFDTIDNQFKALMESLSNTKKMLHDTPQCLALPPPAPRHSN